MPVLAVDEEVLLTEGSHSLLLEDASSTPSYASAVRFGTCSCRAECFRRLSNDAMRQPPLPRSPATSPDTSVDFNAEVIQFAVQR